MTDRAERRLRREEMKAELVGKLMDLAAIPFDVIKAAASTSTGGIFALWGAARIMGFIALPDQTVDGVKTPNQARIDLEGTINNLAFVGIALPPVAGAVTSIVPALVSRGK